MKKPSLVLLAALALSACPKDDNPDTNGGAGGSAGHGIAGSPVAGSIGRAGAPSAGTGGVGGASVAGSNAAGAAGHTVAGTGGRSGSGGSAPQGGVGGSPTPPDPVAGTGGTAPQGGQGGSPEAGAGGGDNLQQGLSVEITSVVPVHGYLYMYDMRGTISGGSGTILPLEAFESSSVCSYLGSGSTSPGSVSSSGDFFIRLRGGTPSTNAGIDNISLKVVRGDETVCVPYSGRLRSEGAISAVRFDTIVRKRVNLARSTAPFNSIAVSFTGILQAGNTVQLFSDANCTVFAASQNLGDEQVLTAIGGGGAPWDNGFVYDFQHLDISFNAMDQEGRTSECQSYPGLLALPEDASVISPTVSAPYVVGSSTLVNVSAAETSPSEYYLHLSSRSDCSAEGFPYGIQLTTPYVIDVSTEANNLPVYGYLEHASFTSTESRSPCVFIVNGAVAILASGINRPKATM
jgi:hypothetical protein